ncbi:protein NRT1/ PTR FAMILY 2.13-like [Typha angustifolia]|uniref:protein NRT1/ PTR FAMILY 2.13-like n=1 Tax=Typha angustifolia TaxID=59011 RepID=UPI003C306F28
MEVKNSLLAHFIHHLKCVKFLKPSPDPKLMDKEGNSKEEIKRKPRGWKCMPYIIGNETCEKVATFGLTANLTVYLVDHFNIGQVEATSITNIFFATTNFAPLLGAFISDAYWGRFKTLAYGCFASLMGMVAMTLSASAPHLQPPKCRESLCIGPSKLQLGVLYLSLGLLATGAGGVRPCSLPFGVDQFDGSTEQGQRDLESYFNWYYGTTTAAAMLALTVVVYVQDSVSWPLGFGIPTGFMLISIIFFFLGTRLYIYVQPEGSVFSGVIRVFVASFRKRRLKLPYPDVVEQQEALLYNPFTTSHHAVKLPLSLQFGFLNKAAIVTNGDLNPDDSPTNRWRLCSVQQIEEVKCLIRIAPIWFSGIICFMAMAQQFTFTILQSLKMDRHLGPHFQIPPGSLLIISLLALTLFMPFYDQIFVPMARRITRVASGITLLQRQGVGLAISSMSMVVAGAVEHKRRVSALSHGGISPMSFLWLAPQLILMGIAEAFSAVGQIEFYNRQFPEQMQTLGSSLFFCSLAGANYLSSLLASIIKKRTRWLDDNINFGRVDYFYYVIAVMGVVNLLYFLLCSHYYRYKGMRSVEEEDTKEKTNDAHLEI